MFTISKEKHSIFFAILVSFLGYLSEGFIYAIISLITKNEAIIYLLTYLLVLTFISILYRHHLKEDIKNFKKDVKGNELKIILTYLGFTILMYITNYILYAIFGNIASNEEIMRSILFNNPIIMSISLCLLGPITEELLFRYPYKNLKVDKRIAFLTYTLLFALIHMTSTTSIVGLWYIIPYILLSLSFGYSFYKTNNIITSVIFHILNNTFTVVLLLTFGG